MPESVIKSQGIARVLDQLPESDLIALLVVLSRGSQEDLNKLAKALERNGK